MKVRIFGAGLLPQSARKPRLLTRACRLALGAVSGEVSIVIVDRRKMLALNKRYLKHAHDTDVIAFRYADEGPQAPLGDIFISARQARLQAKQLGHSVLREVLTLALHGSLHLRGCDDDTPARKARMFRKQDQLLKKLLPS